jgi:hypothetical protein
MLQNWCNFDLWKVNKQLVEFFLSLAINNQVSSERENACCQNSQDVKAFKAKNAVPNLVNLVNFDHIYKCKVHPRERSFQWINVYLI